MFWEIAPLVLAAIVCCCLSYFLQYLIFFEDDEMAGLAYFLSFLIYPISFSLAALAAMKIWGRAALPYGGYGAIAVAVVIFALMWRRKQRLVRDPNKS